MLLSELNSLARQVPRERLQVVILHGVREGNRLQDWVLGLLSCLHGLSIFDTSFNSGALLEVLLPAFGSLVKNAFPCLARRVVELESFFDVFADADTHHHVVREVTQATESAVVLKQHFQDKLSTIATNRVLRYVNAVQSLVRFQAVAKVNCKLIVQHVAVEVEVSEGAVGD